MLNKKNIISIKLIKKLKEKTGANILLCKKSLVETQGNIKQAINYIRNSGKKIHTYNTQNNLTVQGVIIIKTSKNNTYGVIIELNCESDFTAHTKEFKIFSKQVISTALQEKICNITQLNQKLHKQKTNIINKVKENIQIRRIHVIQGKKLGFYLHHNNKIGAIVSATNTSSQLIKQIAMHIVAHKTKYLDHINIPSKIIDNEYKIQLNIASKINKPYNIKEKIIKNQMKKFIHNIILLKQKFILDTNKTVEEILQENHATINNFIYFAIGENT
ncbi:MAG: protein chain elongation factor EF-Ts [Candidatus Westeberhardia cardiocondylae]|nr:protein chain elongation factor EF-Ts [Candidatus Westeberhardia cardiocondylae]